VGVLELVGLGRAAELIRAAEAALQHLSAPRPAEAGRPPWGSSKVAKPHLLESDRPRLITPLAVQTIERGSFALLDFIAQRLAGRPVSTLALFPQYRALQELAGISRAHPADLWTLEWSWRELAFDGDVPPRRLDEAVVHRIEADLLALMRGAAPDSAARLSELFAGLAVAALAPAEAAAVPNRRLATLWQLAAGFFEALAGGLLQPDMYSKRIGSRLLAQLRAGEQAEPSERLARDLLFFCSQAVISDAVPAGSRLAAVRHGHGLTASSAVDYEQATLGRFDPAWLAQARRRVAAAKSRWSAVAGGDLSRLAGLTERFGLVSDSLAGLYTEGSMLGDALQRAAADTVVRGAAPPALLAREVATALLFLEAAVDDGDVEAADALAGTERIQRLALRIDEARADQDPGCLEYWMEALYRRDSERQTLGAVVQELRSGLSEVESGIDLHFRDPSRREWIDPVSAQLSAMLGVLSMLGLDQATQAVQHLRDEVVALAGAESGAQHASDDFECLGDKLGSLGFLIDMVSVQPQWANSLFRFDPETGSLAAAHRRTGMAWADVDGALSTDLQAYPEMREVFLDEAREVIQSARQALADLGARADDIAALQGLRRAFHNLKASARMVGLDALAWAAWACEQLLNVRLGEPAAQAEPALQVFVHGACDSIEAWVQAFAAGEAGQFHADTLVAAADALANPQLPAPAADLAAEPWFDGLAPADPPAPGLPGLQSLLERLPDLPLASDLDLWGSLPEAMAPEPALEPAVNRATQTDPASASDQARKINPAGELSSKCGFATLLDPHGGRPATAGLGALSTARSRIESDVGLLKRGLGEVGENLERLQAQLRDIEWQADSDIDNEVDREIDPETDSRADAGIAAALAVDPMDRDRDTRCQEVTRMVAESVADLAALQRSLQRTLQSTEDMLAHQERMARMARDIPDDQPHDRPDDLPDDQPDDRPQPTLTTA
jgi:chemosensory pili system protein ChpA (sensor histidine kinase/response regulator)